MWLNQRTNQVLLIPLVSWAVPANRSEALFLWPSLLHCARRLEWLPDLVVGDMAYINLPIQRKIRERLGVAVLTRMRADMHSMPPFTPELKARCAQGQELSWLGLEERDQLHWFGVSDTEPLCAHCWLQSDCPRQFSYAPSEHEILFGKIPLGSRVAQKLLREVRPWVEPAQSYEKNQLGLNQMFLNSLFVTWINCLLADTAVLLRAHALLGQPQNPSVLRELFPQQLSLGVDGVI